MATTASRGTSCRCFYSCPATMGNDWESSRHGNPERGRVESSPWAYGQGKGRKRGWESSCHGHTVSSPVDCHILPRKEGGFSVYVSNILKHSLEILGLPISGFPGYVAKQDEIPGSGLP